jgi:predicted acylesterase/phospholipase RssA
MMGGMVRRLRPDLPFRRIAVVLSGGGALAAYETGVLRTLERIGLRPSIVSGASAGALNAVAWVAHDFRAAALERVWRQVDAAEIGMRWTTIALRAAGGLLLVLGVLQAVVSWTGSSDVSFLAVFRHGNPVGLWPTSSLLDIIAWMLVAAGGFALLRSSREAEKWLARFGDPESERRFRIWGAVVLLLWSLAHLITWLLAWPWPHRFSATLLAVTAGIWLLMRSRRAGAWARSLLFLLMPETDGRGLWGSAARRHLLSRLVGTRRLGRLWPGETHLILSALALDNGRIAHFVNWPDVSPRFRARVEAALGEVISLQEPKEVLEAAIASSAIPVLFEPARIGGRDFVDAVAFSMHPLRAAIYDDADAAVIIVVAPSGAPPAPRPPRNPFEVWGRYLDLANWRDLQQELIALPASWRAKEPPVSLCLVEPEAALPGGVLAYTPRAASQLIRRGEQDALRALDHAGWLES